MNHRFAFVHLLAGVLLLVLTPAALASTTWYVNGANGNDSNNCLSSTTACKTIGHAISLASSGDTVMVARAVYFETLTISFSLNVIGAGEGGTIVDGGQGATVVTISNTVAHVSLSKVTIRNGFGFPNGMGGGIYNSGTLTISESTVSGNFSQGGGIYNAGVLTINNSTIRGNYAASYYGPPSGGGIYNESRGTVTINNTTVSGNRADCNDQKGHCLAASGGGIENLGTLTINNSTVSGNSSTRICCFGSASGGGIANGGTLTINNSTLGGNYAADIGGGINNVGGTAAINNSTVSGNSATGSGGGIRQGSGTVTLQNTIVANSTSGGNCSGTMTSNGYNLSSDATCAFSGPGDMNSTDPMLGSLQRNGGDTQTMALPSGSPAIDAGNPAGCTDGLGHLLKTDQRGKPRPDKEDTGGCDVGAYESQTD